jgi:hypothetical protein
MAGQIFRNTRSANLTCRVHAAAAYRDINLFGQHQRIDAHVSLRRLGEGAL